MGTARNNSWPFLLCVLVSGFFMCNKLYLTTAADTITLGESLSGDQTIVSKNQHFELGFFRPGKTSKNYYIGIWYKFSVETVVWVANRDAPILDPSSSKFTFLDGNLVLLNKLSKTPIWSTNLASNTLTITQVVLGDDGNLVLREGSNPSVVIWQSFDYPTDTWLPGAKLGFNKKNDQSLTSWRSREDPATGFYNYELRPNGKIQLAIYWNKSEEIWKTGEWEEKSKTFSLIPEIRLNYNRSKLNYSYISNVNESYFTYSLYNKSTIARTVMDISGQLKKYAWSEILHKWNLWWLQPKRLCDVYNICGPFGNCNQETWKCECLTGFVPRSPTDWSLQDSTGGCVRRIPLQCESKDGFLAHPNSELPDKPRVPPIYSAEECKSACESSCGCIAYSFINEACRTWSDDIINFNQFNSSSGELATFYLRLAAAEIRSIVPMSSRPVLPFTSQ
ncbi:hypothetical protein MKX03_031302, partial [Papaver bracteatum]